MNILWFLRPQVVFRTTRYIHGGGEAVDEIKYRLFLQIFQLLTLFVQGGWVGAPRAPPRTK